MKKTALRSWHSWLLAASLLLAPQLAFVHALSHAAWAQAGPSSNDERQTAPDKACNACLALAQLASALPSHFEWQSPVQSPAEPAAVSYRNAAPRTAALFRARAPPALS